MKNHAPIRKRLPLCLLLLAGCAATEKGPTTAVPAAPLKTRVSNGYKAPQLVDSYGTRAAPSPLGTAERRVERTRDLLAPSPKPAVTAASGEATPRVPSPPVGLAVKAAHRKMTPLPDLDEIVVTDSRTLAERQMAERKAAERRAAERRTAQKEAAARRAQENAALAAAELKLAALSSPSAGAAAPGGRGEPSMQTASYRPRAEEAVAVAAAPPARAPSREPALPRSGFAIHLASYKDGQNAVRGWEVLSGEHASLSTLSPLTIPVTIEGKGDFVRLIAGPFEIGGEAEAACDAMREIGRYCAVVPFEGKPL